MEFNLQSSKQKEASFISRGQGRMEQQELMFVFNPKVNAINLKSDSYYTVSSLPQTWRAAI
ncbi:hypothetical protein LU631_12560 [Erwinia tracheiphila]|uniref:hypothetical protein n=1 Tax=Erwinia tracheiphila TaxID=65700 RepID=UPI00033DA5F1|nr:hypothetical protein [Erwinia tracheiphila]EOS92957.1 hypothetical protein ETR_21697 [Erwinia tracheiphila PSU-1]UIA81879.1 hypothetical protein LU604_14360 [Erwinia tracheiphila]UIA89866.1 hypothetical protein LU631_12560 [Erwinia tracheiphila]UIA90476.1 hypothetical protein LU632_13925 [Erwinia tracheiphila]UIA98169.1 hypothetical protein LU633_10765 [Erwinia tracheiphila]